MPGLVRVAFLELDCSDCCHLLKLLSSRLVLVLLGIGVGAEDVRDSVFKFVLSVV